MSNHAFQSNSFSLPIIQETLANGVKWIAVHRPQYHTVGISVYVKTGSRFETAEENGISHFLEHMIFRGTLHHPTAFELNSAFERLGATINGSTTPDSTEFSLSLPRQNAEKGIALLSQMVTVPHFNEMDTERKIIVEEILEDYDEHGSCIDIDSLSRTRIWGGGTLCQPITGSIDTVSKLQYGDLDKWFQSNYAGKNMVVCIAGDVNEESLLMQLQTAFSTVPSLSGRRNQIVPHTTLPMGDKVVHVHKPGSQTQLRTAFRTPGLLHTDYQAVEILLRLIDDGMSTPLHRRVFEDLALAYNVGAELEAYEDTGVLNIDALASHDNIAAIVKETAQIVADIREGRFSDTDLEKAQNRAVWDLQALQDFPGALNNWYGEQEMYRPAVHPQEAAEKIRSLDRQELIRMAAQIFDGKNRFITTVGIQSARQQETLRRQVDATP